MPRIIPDKRRGSRRVPTEREWQALKHLERAKTLARGETPTFTRKTSQSYDITTPDVEWGYCVAISDDGKHILFAPALEVDSPFGWAISSKTTSYRRIRMAPGYTADYFVFHVVEGQPTAEDLPTKVIGGYAVPDFRMRLVAPAALDQICEPCSQPNPIQPPNGRHPEEPKLDISDDQNIAVEARRAWVAGKLSFEDMMVLTGQSGQDCTPCQQKAMRKFRKTVARPRRQ